MMSAAATARTDRPTSLPTLRQRASLLSLLFLLIVGAALGVGAWQLARAQSNDRADLRDRYAERATIASALVDSLFRLAFQQGAGTSAERYGSAVSSATLDAQVAQQRSEYLAILTADGRLVAASRKTPKRVRTDELAQPHAKEALTSKLGYALSDVLDGPAGPVIETVTRFPSASGGERLQVGGSSLKIFSDFLSGSLKPLTPVGGGDAYVLDSAGHVIAAISASGRTRAPDRALVESSAKSERGTYKGTGGERFYARTSLPGSRWRIALSAPTAQLYSPASGTSRWLPWVILSLCALAFLAIAGLIRRTVIAGERLGLANAELERSQDRLRDRAGELQRSNTELQRSNADLEQFAYVASHDLSAPLRAVAGFSQLLAARYAGKLDGAADEFIRHMQEGVDRMQRIIDDLLAYSRVDRSELSAETVDLNLVLEDVLRGLGPDLEEARAKVTSESLPTVRGERGQLGQVLQNLVANGIKFTAPGVDPEVQVRAVRDGDCWRVEVRDNGIGVEPEHAERIFKMFQRLHGPDDYPGTGIGLAISKKIVERHGGRLLVEPAAEGGSVFSFTVQDKVAS
jgi:signal transduction histidine kinase